MSEAGVAALAFDLHTIVEDVLNGRQSLEAALRLIAEQAAFFADEPKARARLARSLAEELLPLREEVSAVRVLDTARLLQAAAGLIASAMERLVALMAASFLLELGSYQFARDLLADALASREDAEPEEILAIECQWLRCLRFLGESRTLEQDLPAALELARTQGDQASLVRLLEIEAGTLAPRDVDAALARLDEAIDRRSRLGSEAPFSPLGPLPEETMLWAARGEIARNAGHFEEALRSYEQARASVARNEMPRLAATYMLSEIGMTWQRAGEMERASAVLQRAAEEALRLGDHRAAGRWWPVHAPGLPAEQLTASDTLANAFRLLQEADPDFEAAFVSIKRSIQQAREERLPETEVLARNLLGYFYSLQKAFFRARMAFEEALVLARGAGLRNLELVVLLNLCMALVDMSLLGEAHEGLERAVVLGKELRSETPSSELRKTLSGRLVVAYELLILLFLGWEKSDGSWVQKPDADRVLRLGQQAQAVNLVGWLAFQATGQASQDPEIGAAARTLRETEARIERAAAGGAALGPLLAERQRREHRLARALAAAGHPYSVEAAPILGLCEVAATLPPGTVFVDLFAATSDVFFVAVSGEGDSRSGSIPWDRDDRLAFVDRWETALAAVRASLDAQGDLRGWRLSSNPLAGRSRPAATAGEEADLSSLLDELRRSFLSPLLEKALGEVVPAKLYISPHRELYELPFWTLAEPLLQTCFSILPSAGCLPPLLQRTREPGGGRRFKIGDATGTLPYSRLELDTLGAYEGLPARLGALLQHAPQAGMLHFAGHGLFDELNPYDSGLIIEALLPPGTDPELFGLERRWPRPCRRLTVTGILSVLELPRCELVVLSACCTGLPQLHPASEFTSLPAAFLVAGARNVIASLWPTHDGATALLMQELYAGLGGGMPPAEALRAARQHLACMPREEAVRRLGTDACVPLADLPFASPTFTMAFQCYGVD